MSERAKITVRKSEATRDKSDTPIRKTESFQSKNSPVAQILHLQHTIGNQSVQRFVESGIIKTKLRIGQPNDIHRQEADRVADAVMRMPEPQMQRQPEEEEERKEEKELIQAKPISAQITPLVQRQVEEEEKKEEDVLIQTKGRTDQTPAVTANFEARIAALKGGGQPLPCSARAFFEPRFGHDLSTVRVHTDSNAVELARSMNAKAFTTGSEVVFDYGQYSPETPQKKNLLTHELVHVVQQSGAGRFRYGQSILLRQPEHRKEIGVGLRPLGDVSVYVGRTMTCEAALRQVYRECARKISQQALRMVEQGSAVEDAARWAHQARNDLKVLIRARGSPIIRGFAEARNMRVYKNKIGPTYEQLIREGKTPRDIVRSAGMPCTKVNRVATTLKVGGRFCIGVDLAVVTWEVISAPEGERVRTAVAGGGRVAGAIGLGWAGAKAGGAIGSFFGPVGTLVGGVIGGVGGALIGGWLGGKSAEKVYDLVENLVNPPSGSVWDLQVIVIDGVEDEYIRTQACRHP